MNCVFLKRDAKVFYIEMDKLTKKLQTLKDNVFQLKERLEKDIYSKLEDKTKLLRESISENEKLNKQIENMEEEIKRLKSVEEEFDVYRNKFDLLLKDKMNMEKYNIKQEQNIRTLENEIQNLNEECKEKDIKYKNLDKTYANIINIIALFYLI